MYNQNQFVVMEGETGSGKTTQYVDSIMILHLEFELRFLYILEFRNMQYTAIYLTSKINKSLVLSPDE